jgi:hypothetical protein
MFYTFSFGKAPKKLKNKWKVSMQFIFQKTSNNNFIPTIRQLNTYMSKNNRFKKYIIDLFLYDGYNKKPGTISFKNGIVSFLIDPTVLDVFDQIPIFPTVESLLHYLKNINLADGIWEGMPGSHGVYPDHNKNELGVINYDNIKIQIV